MGDSEKPEWSSSDEGLSIETLPLPVLAAKKYKTTTRRDVKNIDTILVHQTAVGGGFGVSSSQIAKAGSAEAARAKRFQETTYHAIYSPKDQRSRIQWPLWAYTYHGNGANKYSIGLAYDGKFPGDVLDVEGFERSLAHVVTRARQAGAPIKYVEAHRQHWNQRGADLGQEIWQKAIMPMLGPLNLQQRRDHVTGSGLTIPDSWQ